MLLFSRARGQVISLPDPAIPASISLRLENWGGFVAFKSAITRITVNARGNYQFLHTLGGQVFIYVFGDRIGDLVLSGVAFDSICQRPVGLIGIENVLNYYSFNRLANRKIPLIVTIGAATTLRGYLLEVTGDVRDTQTRTWEFSMRMALVPVDTSPTPGEIVRGTTTTTGGTTTTGSSGSTTSGGLGGTGQTGTFPQLPDQAGRSGRIESSDSQYDVDADGWTPVFTGPRTLITVPTP